MNNMGEITPEYIKSNLFKPKDNIAEKILKCEAK